MSVYKEKVRDLFLSDEVVMDVTGGGGEEGGKTYQSGDGVLVDNTHDKINADYATIAAKLNELADPFPLSSQVAAAIAKSDLTYSDGVKKDGTAVKANYGEIAAALRSLPDPFAVDSEVTAEEMRAKAAEKGLSVASDQKLYIDALSAKSLSAIHADAETYYQKVYDGTVQPNELYVLSCKNYINCFDERVANVADAREAHDAISKSVMEKYGSSNFVDLRKNQEISGYKQFVDGLDVGDRIDDVGNNCFAVGNDLTVGSYSFFYKGIDIDKTHLSAKIYLTTEQPRYPMPFCIFNGDKSKIRILTSDVTIELTSTYNGLSNSAGAIWNCTLTNAWRDDYNQLCIDLGPTYQSDLNAVKTKLKDYIEWAFAPEEEIKQYLEGQSLVGEKITMVNGDKIAYLRCGTVLRVMDDAILEVQLTEIACNGSTGFVTGGYHGFSDFDYDDASLVFIDKPLLLGPANTSTYSSINVGVLNEVLRRGSMAVGKQNIAEADFAMALGRRANARHYCSFVWGPAQVTDSVTNYSFNIGLSQTLANSHANASKTDGSDIYVIGKGNQHEHLFKYVVECLLASNDAALKSRFKTWLGL